MARLRTTATELARLLHAAPRPVYALDDRLAIVFCNQACLDWVGLPPEQVLGRRCAYHSSGEASGADAAAAGLCPPPGALSAAETRGIVACVGASGELRRRRAQFLGLGARAEEPVGLWALVEAADLPDAELSAAPDESGSEAARLHDQVRRFRHQAAARFQADRLIGQGPAMRRARAQIEAAAASRASVSIVGPKGSGRQHAAQAIHYSGSTDNRGMFVPLACSVLPGETIQSTLAAMAARQPAGPDAPRSTLLLNDVDQLAPDVQGQLFATLSSRSFAMRLVSTAAASLLELARGGGFREDLAVLLSTLVIELPPLAQRREDLPLLAQALVEEVNARGEKQVRGLTPEALDRLDGLAWPGNIDELARVLADAHARAEGPEITVRDLPKAVHWAADAAAHPRRVEETIVLDEYLGQVERELLRRALAQAKGNKAKAARLLGMTRPRLYRRLVQLGLD